jgi:CRISPR-associated endonuclease/helicase Cas3
MPHFAHSLKDKPPTEWHPLDRHLASTAERAERFASPFATGWGRLAGLLHDAGKYQQAFQNHLAATGDHTKVDHSIVGALIAIEKRAAALAFVIAGHHAGLADKQDLLARLQKKQSLLQESRDSGMPASLENFATPQDPPLSGAARALWTRFLFSALVDADDLDTESFFQHAERDIPPADLQALSTQLDSHLDAKIAASDPTPVNILRARVLEDCRAAAPLSQGMFTLTVPTGGGKTLSSLSFALRHAVKHNLRRVLFVVPFTSIIDQTAQTYRDILGAAAIIEHHSNLDPDEETLANQTACENWDAGNLVQDFGRFRHFRPKSGKASHRLADSRRNGNSSAVGLLAALNRQNADDRAVRTEEDAVIARPQTKLARVIALQFLPIPFAGDGEYPPAPPRSSRFSIPCYPSGKSSIEKPNSPKISS